MAHAQAQKVWRVEIRVPRDVVAQFEGALEPYCQVITWYVEDDAASWRMEGFCADAPSDDALAAALSRAAKANAVPCPAFAVQCQQSDDWVAENQKQFPPFSVGRFFIHGTHFDAAAPVGKMAMCINPGAAFGSGQHATTAGCLRALDDLAKERKFARPLDMGCGSGILAMAMARLWRVRVIAVDIDPIAIPVTVENAGRNALGRYVRAFQSHGYRSRGVCRGGPYDLIVSNILARPLMKMANALECHLAPGGVAVLSGLLERDTSRVLEAYRRRGLFLMRKISMDGWDTLVLSRPGGAPWGRPSPPGACPRPDGSFRASIPGKK
ncbi:50S ribosomal protein L11 methyltransferase [Varunaivibrio sulfuroxidans]|uniref:Ribosomal protein L11 methyltransferase n=1 Tax=Varunaivibrio sulfuroxidans TaxID=1773489 RepID=A0A4R3JCR7_9PROT|nr:50S ribosomal protein L11 methyltransferase [Varunaivibrio sulfuroxidans]TCS63562.1 [LSU ribosomal protein L11P]-lysine N-methyltransferase [Varunaivibrio sulfuroxidans]WES30293.1 50S ribosomal protein L11 methyltransferase [Varunaivibrio sulfuroxidans]